MAPIDVKFAYRISDSRIRKNEVVVGRYRWNGSRYVAEFNSEADRLNFLRDLCGSYTSSQESNIHRAIDVALSTS